MEAIVGLVHFFATEMFIEFVINLLIVVAILYEFLSVDF